MGTRIAGFLFCLVFAVPFGSVGLLAALGVGKYFLDSHRAKDWVVVQARVDEAALNLVRGRKGGTTYSASAAYRYTIGGKEYVSTRLGLDPLPGSDNLGDWQEEMAAFMDDARKSGRTVPVFVNPDHPEDAVVDRDVRGPMVAMMSTFALLFGGVGLAALVGGGFILLRKEPSKKKRAQGPSAEASNEAQIQGAGKGMAIGLWIFALIWNGVSWPMAYVILSRIMVNREWLGFLIVLFPLIGLSILWGAIKYTVTLLRRGRATLWLDTLEPCMGGRIAGAVAFPKPGTPGELFEIELCAYNPTERQSGNSATPRWSASRQVRLAAHPRGGSRLPFQIDIPARVARSDAGLVWMILVKVAGEARNIVDTFTVVVGPPVGDVSALPEAEAPPDIARNAQAMAKLFGDAKTQ